MAPETLANAETILQLFLEQTKVHAVIVVDVDGRIRSWPPGAEHIFEMTAAEVMNQPVSVLFTPEDRAKGIAEHEVETATSHGVAEDDRWLARRADASARFWASGVMTAVRADDGSIIGYVKTLRDRTDLQEQLETLRNQVRASEDAHNRKDIFLSTLSHELRTPLAPLTTAVQLIRMIATPHGRELDRALAIIERQVDSLTRLVNDLLDVSRIGAGKIHLSLQPTALHEVLHRAADVVRPLVLQRRHVLEILLPTGPLVVEADPARLEQVFVNLLTNAAKYTPEGGHIWVKGTTEGREAVVHVEDSGVGIPHEMLPRIFELFTQVEASRMESQGGLGIGLSLVKDLVSLHGGSVQVRSDGPGKGSEFTVRLPLRLGGLTPV